MNKDTKDDNKSSIWKPPEKIDPDYGDWIEYVKLRHSRRLQNLQIKLIILAALLAAGIILVNNNRNDVLLAIFGFVVLSTLLYIDERSSLDYLEKEIYKNAQHTKISTSAWRWISYIGITVYVCFMTYLALNSFGLLNLLSPQTPTPPSAYLAIVAYNQSILPNDYHISIQNLGSLASQGFSFVITPTNSLVKISSVHWQYLGINWIPIGQNQSALLIVSGIQAKGFGSISINLTGKSGISINQVQAADNNCNEIFYGINEYGNISTNTLFGGSCNSTILRQIIFNTEVKTEVKVFQNCSNIAGGNINIGAGSPKVVGFSIPPLESQQVTYYIYKNGELINTLLPNTYNDIILNFSGIITPTIFEVYSPGDKNYSCSELLLRYNGTGS